ncbi:MAG TPA: winged helix-turn-helix domain-containing protein [Gaiellaceae bacterium]
MPDSWAFITSHAAVLLEVQRNPQATVRELASSTGLTERQVHRVIGDLCESGYVIRSRQGRRNEYAVNPEQPMRHRTVAHHRIEELLTALGPRT